MNERLLEWNRRYGRGQEVHDYRPSPPLATAIDGVPSGRALDPACGAGRHALFLAERGWQVVAVDGSAVGLSLLAAEADRRSVGERITRVEADLTVPGAFPIEPGAYDLVCDFYYLNRELFPALGAGVRPGGRFVAAIHVEAADAPHRYLLAPGELRAVAVTWGFDILHWREGTTGESGHHHPTSELIALRP